MRTLWFVMTMGQLMLAHGQTFNERFDPFGQHYPQVAWSVDPNGTDGYAVTVAGYYDDSVYVYVIPALIRLDAQGQVLSESKMVDGVHSIYPGTFNSAQRVRDGGIAMGGSMIPPSEIHKACIIRYAENGDSLWLREYGNGVNGWVGRQVKQTKDGGYILAGEHVAGNHTDGFLIKTDSAGNEEWTSSYGGPYSDYAMTVDTTADDGYFVGGQYKVTQNDKNLWVFRVNGNGDTLWSKQWGAPGYEPNAHLTTIANGNPIIASATDFINDAAGRMYMAELDQNDGHIVWERRYGPPFAYTSLFSCKEVLPGQGTIAAGVFEPPDSSGLLKGVLLRCAPNGDSLWMRTYLYYDSLMNDGRGEFKDVLPTADGGFIACGMTNGSYSGNNPPGYEQDAWVVKVDSLGCIIPGCADFGTAISAQITNMGYALRVYPNPVGKAYAQLHVGINLPSNFKTKGPLVLFVVSSEGILVRQEAVPTSAPNEVVLDVTGLVPGAYTLHLSDAHTWIAGKIFVLE